MKKYQIIKNKNCYAIATKKDIKDYYKKHFLPIEKIMKRKKDLINLINTSKTFEQYKGNTDFKTIFIY